jgi:hypothetical protein
MSLLKAFRNQQGPLRTGLKADRSALIALIDLPWDNVAMLKAALAVVAGIVSIFVIAVGLDFLVEHLLPSQYGPQREIRSWWMLLVILGYTLLACLWGGHITATIARERATGASLVLAALIVSATVVNLTMAPSKLPLWWKTLCLLLEAPAVGLGGWLRIRAGNSAARSVA